jgi:hypothetical protein
MYKDYELHYWKIDSIDKRDKFCYKTMTKPNAHSSSTNIEHKDKNVLMIYLYDSKWIELENYPRKLMLIMNPWNGQQ